MKAYIFNIQRNSIHDGPGIRTTVFFKGCPLHCRWCCNPESQKREPVLYHERKRCIQCHECIDACPFHNLEIKEKLWYCENQSLCSKCTDRSCVSSCRNQSLQYMGEEMTVEELEKIVAKDKIFYKQGNGGVTASGGEPLLHSAYLNEFFKICHKDAITTAVETSLHVPWDSISQVIPETDYFICDYKHIDKNIFEKWTGGNLDLVESNLRKLLKKKKDVVVRIPVIPRFNEYEEVIKSMGLNLKHIGVKQCELLPYHRLGQVKYENMNLPYEMKDVQLPDGKKIKEWQTKLNDILQ